MKGTVEYWVSVCFGVFFAIFVSIKLVVSVIFFGKKAVKGPKFRSRPKILTERTYGKPGFLHLKKITMHYVESGDRSKPLLLLVHGFPEFWFSWRHQLRSDLTRRFNVVAVDLRGYGNSDKPIGVEKYRVELIVEDLKEAIEALGYSSCNLVGHDWGGIAAWSLAMWHPALVDKLAILNCPHPSAYSLYMRSHRDQFFKSWYMFFFQLPIYPEWLIGRQDLATVEEALIGKSQGVRRGMISSEELEAFKYSLCEPGSLTGPVNYFRAAFRYPHENSNWPNVVMQPVLLLFGSRDKFICEEAVRLSAKFCNSLDMRNIHEAGHWLQQDAPDQVNQLLSQFFAPERARAATDIGFHH